MDNNQSYRVHTDIGQDKKLDIHLQQNVGLLQILSLNLRQSDAYINKSSNYGIIVGRVLANEAFGIENVKVSVFIPVTDDYFVDRIRSVYPYRDATRRNGINGHRYNLLEDDIADECHADVGTFPNKRLVLDDNTYIEVFDKYYKYTTVTNKAGDYMIYGVPTGNQQIHIDLDLSNIGILSQKPRDFYYKGYGPELFKNAEQFKTSKNLDNLVQIITQNRAVDVYPFWGDEQNDTVAITRCDMNVDYEFQSTCIFMGSVVTDGEDNAVGNRCLPARYVGKNKKLIAGEGTIEMIRKTQDGYVEEYNLKGGRLIDADGVWCYQIPMNLDYVQTDEEGNLIPSQDPSKGIATRARVRFRMSIDDMSGDGKSKHRAKYLVPNNPIVDESGLKEGDISVGLKYDGPDLNNQYIYGSETQESDFRDLQWNKVYTVKSFIPRIVNGASKKHFLPQYRENKRAFLGIKSSNNADPNNPFPYNSFMGTISFSYKIICNILSILLDIVYDLNKIMCDFLDVIANVFKVLTLGIGKKAANKLKAKPCIKMGFSPYIFIVGCSGDHKKTTMNDNDCGNKEVQCIYTPSEAKTKIQQGLAEEFDVIDLDFSNDWVNGVLYFPMWHWLKKKKKKFFWGLFSKKAVDRFCNCDNGSSNALQYHYVHAYDSVTRTNMTSQGGLKSKNIIFSKALPSGIVKQFYNKDNVDIYYYAPAVIGADGYRGGTLNNTNIKGTGMYRLFATDIVLIGSLMNDDMDGVGKLFRALPQTSANIPPLAQEIEQDSDTLQIDTANGLDIPYGTPLVSGLDEASEQSGDGTFFGLTCNTLYPMKHGLVNVQRICELGVSADETHYYPIKKNGDISYGLSVTDALITKIEMYDANARAEFATYNSNPLLVGRLNKLTGYKTYNYEFKYPLNFDGTMAGKKYGMSAEKASKSYLDFRYGKVRHFYNREKEGFYTCPIFNNSFYFYFGLKAGKTAIDKFRATYYVDCIKDDKLAFPVGITVLNRGKSCRNEANIGDFPAVQVNLISASKPYEMYIKDSEGEEVFRIQDCNQDKLTFRRYFEVNEEFGKQVVSGIEMGADVYTVYVRDSMGNVSYNKLDLQIEPIIATTEVLPFKVKSDTFVGIDHDKCGNFTLTSISVDGSSPKNIVSLTESQTIQMRDIDNIDDIAMTNGWIVEAQYDDNSSEYFLCYTIDEIDNMDFYNGRWYTENPASITLLIAKLCPTNSTNTTFKCLIDFVGRVGVQIEEYQPYIMTLNNVDIEGWVTNGSRVADSYNQEHLATAYDPKRISYWNPSSFVWNNKPMVQQSYWEDVIDGYKNFATDIEKAVSICAYKMNSIFDICNILYQTTTDSTPVAVKYNCKGMDMYPYKGGVMAPFESTGSEQTAGSLTSFYFDNLTSFNVDANMPTYCNPYTYIFQVPTTILLTFFALNNDGVTLEVEEPDLDAEARMFTGNLTNNKNKLLFNYNQKNGFYNCMVYSYEDKKVLSQAPEGAVYSPHVLTLMEVGSWAKNWLSFDTYDCRVGSNMYLYKKSNGDLTDCVVFGAIAGGLFFATDENHNVISSVKNGEQPTTTYSFNTSELYANNPTVHTNTNLAGRLYDFSITDNWSDPNPIQYEPVTGDLIVNKRIIPVNTGFSVIQTSGDFRYSLINNSWNIELESDISIQDASIPENNNIAISGIVQEGNSFSVNIPEASDSTYSVSYGSLGNEANYISGIYVKKVQQTSFPFSTKEILYCKANIEVDGSNGTIGCIRLNIENTVDNDGTIYCCCVRGGAEAFMQKVKQVYSSLSNEDKLDSGKLLKNTLQGLSNKSTAVYRTVRDVLNEVTVCTDNSISGFTSGKLDMSDSHTYFDVPEYSVFKNGATGPYPADIPFPVVVIERRFDPEWDRKHLMNDLFVISETTAQYTLPYQSISNDVITGKEGWNYYYFDKSTKTYEQITLTNGQFAMSDIQPNMVTYNGSTAKDFIAERDGEYCRIQLTN